MDAEVKNEAIAMKISKDDLKVLSGVKVTSYMLGQGSYGTVYKAEYDGTECAVKQVDYGPEVRSVIVYSQPAPERVEQNFLRECLQHSKLRHPNIVKMLGVFYPKKQSVLPFLVMELMEYNLTQLLDNHQNISMYIKLSILQDVSRGLRYLHAQNPPIVHQALYSDNILFTKGLSAKIGDFKTGAETVSEQALLSVRQSRDNSGFLPDSVHILKYDVSLNVFSFGCVMCHVITQRCPSRQPLKRSEVSLKMKHGDCRASRRKTTAWENIKHQENSKILSYTMDDWCVEKHQNYIDMISDNSLKQLVEACLQRNPENRPHMSLIYERITRIIAGRVDIYMCVYVCMYIYIYIY